MTFEPVLPAAVLIIIAAVFIATRALSLRRVLRRTGSGRHVRGVLRWGGLTLAVLLLMLAAARPALQAGDARSRSVPSAAAQGSNVNVFFVVDRSVNSRVEDFGDHKSRMAGIRDDIASLIDQYPHARFAVISFSSRPSLDWPLSEDVWSLKPMIAGLSPYSLAQLDARYQVNAAAASDILRYKLQQAEHQFLHSKNLVFYFGEGAGGSRAPQGSFDLGSAKVAGGAVLGYGTTPGGPIPAAFANGQMSYVVDAQSSADANSAINEPALRAIADQLHVPYIHRQNGQGITAVTSAVNAGGTDDATVVASVVGEGTEMYWALTLVAAALVLGEIYLSIREFRRNRAARRDLAL